MAAKTLNAAHRGATAGAVRVESRLEPLGARLRVYCAWSAALLLVFILVYGGVNAWTEMRELRFRLYMEWELSIPRIPEAILVYVSIQPLFALPLLRLPAARIRGLGRTLLRALLLAGAIFILVPAELGFERTRPDSWLAPAFEALYVLDGPHNLIPSLHVAMSAVVLLYLGRDDPAPLRMLWAGWWLALCLSVLLTHQHHLLDVIAGAVLGVACYGASGDGAGAPSTRGAG